MANENYNNWHKEIYQTDLELAIKQNRKYFDYIIRELMLDNLRERKNILDVPCGRGGFLKYIERNGLNLNLSGLDISDYAIDCAKQDIKGDLRVGNSEYLPFQDDFFDFIICIGGLEYYDNPKKGVSEMARVLKSAGKVFIHVPNLMFLGHIYLAWKDGRMPSEGGGEKGEYYSYEIEKFYTYKGWKDIIEKSGLKVVRSYKYNDINGSSKVSCMENVCFNLIKHFIPFNLSYNFIFICNKGENQEL